MGLPFIVGLGHKARQGKDTLALELLALAPKRIKLFAFADDLKAWCRVTGFMGKKDGPVLQIVGTDLFRNKVHPDYWISCLQPQLEECKMPIAIVTDVRFTNEANFIKDNSGIVVKVTREMPDGRPFIDPTRSPSHASETDLDHYAFDYEVTVKEGDMEEIPRSARMLMNLIEQRMQ